MGGFPKIVRLSAVAVMLALVTTGSVAPPRVQSKPVAYTISSWFKGHFPHQMAATQVSSDPHTTRWAFIIGINPYPYPTPDLIGAHNDAVSLWQSLVNLGWRKDHIALLLDGYGAASHIIDGIRWLASKTTSSSTVVFHYSGQETYTRTTADGDNETMDIELVGADNRTILDGVLGREMNRVAAGHMWIDFATCRSAGFSDYGMVKTGRILTYSSKQSEWSYEDPRLKHSVFSYYEIVSGLYYKHADSNRDGKVSVEEAFYYSRNPTTISTGYKQHPQMIDKVYGYMYLTIS
ncbi:MAG: caspase family protein [Actinomycetota bacterium]